MIWNFVYFQLLWWWNFTMGCSFSGGSSVNNPRVFRVYNVDDHGQEVHSGRMQITDTELILYQKGKESVHWPLRSLRRYGFDAELFSFESGRRCPTGQGIYAFKCRRAEALFNLLQECLQKAGQDDVAPSRQAGEAPARPTDLTGDNPTANGELAYSQFATPTNGSNVTSATRTNPALDTPNGGNRVHEYVNTSVAGREQQRPSLDVASVTVSLAGDASTPSGMPTINYAELDLPGNREPPEGANIMYINMPKVEPNGNGVRSTLAVGNGGDEGHNYANLDLVTAQSVAPPVLQSRNASKGVHYVQLDLHGSQENLTNGAPPPASPVSLVSSNLPDSPLRKASDTQSYAQIDFNRTAALSNSAKAANARDDGARKTRHNSNIEELNWTSSCQQSSTVVPHMASPPLATWLILVVLNWNHWPPGPWFSIKISIILPV